jgi:hypothetical protein
MLLWQILKSYGFRLARDHGFAGSRVTRLLVDNVPSVASVLFKAPPCACLSIEKSEDIEISLLPNIGISKIPGSFRNDVVRVYVPFTLMLLTVSVFVGGENSLVSNGSMRVEHNALYA